MTKEAPAPPPETILSRELEWHELQEQWLQELRHDGPDKKHLRDGFYLTGNAWVVADWIERHIRVPVGKGAGELVSLRDWQLVALEQIYGRPDCRRCIITFGRKNGKTALAAMLLLVHLVGPMKVRNTELYSSALSRDQAAILFRLAAKMIRFSPLLKKEVVVRETIKELHYPRFGTTYAALSADASTAMGKSPIFLVHDELGQVHGPIHRLYDSLETATSAHEEPLSIVISTQAPTENDLLSILIDDAMSGADPRTRLLMWTAPEDADPFDIETIKLANPAFGDFQNEREILDMAEQARRMPAREAEYRNLILNQRVETTAPFVTKGVWKDNGGPPEPLGLVYAGLDLSEINDLTAFVCISESDQVFDIHCRFWLPEEGIDERSRNDRVPYNVWAKQGHITLTPGRSIAYKDVAAYIVEFVRSHTVRKIAFDRYNWRHLRPWIISAGMTEAEADELFEEFGQGFVSMGPAVRTLESLLLNNKMRHGGNPVLQMCAFNAVVKVDEAGNKKLDKKRSRGRIDGMVALAMAAGVADTSSHEQHVFEQVDLEEILEDA
jgi:phage terminase large subunit-like protein